MLPISMSSSGAQLKTVDLEAAEHKMGCPIPQILKDFYLQQNGGAPDRSYFTNSENTWWFDWMHPIALRDDGDTSNSLQTVYNQMVGEELIPARCLPFGIDPGGNFFLLDVDTGKVWYMPMDAWDRALSAEQNWQKDGRDLSVSFDAFMDSLTEDSPF